MRLVCIGTGTAVPDPEHVGSGFWVEAGEARVLLDCGPGVVQGMARHGLPWETLTHLVLTHFHNDHIGDVPYLFFALRWGTFPPRKVPLIVVGPPGTRRLLQRLGRAFGDHVSDPDFQVAVHELREGGEVQLWGGARLRTCATPHTERSLGCRIEAPGQSLGYTSDTGESDDVAAFMAGVDLLVAECSLPDGEIMPTHLTPKRLARMARLALPKRLLVTHVYPQLDRAELPALLAAGGWPGEVVVVHDGWRSDTG
jgi:ribonuclease BN (tRNA processing enzyme)